MTRMKTLMFLLALIAQVPLASATVTYVVGTCKPNLPSFTNINDALGASPAPNVVEVCPGTYPEEVGIYKPVTLEGVPSGNSDQAIITVPSGGVFIDGGDDLGDFVAAQILVQNVTGEVNISNLTIDATGNNETTPDTYVVGVFFQNSSGTVNHLTVQNQNGNSDGVGIWVEGGSAKPSVTVENNNLQAFDHSGIYAETDSNTSELTATISGNDVTSAFSSVYGIDLERGQTATVTGNLISNGSGSGILIGGGAGSVSGNKVVGTPLGIDREAADSVSITSNTIYNTLGGYGIGILVNTAGAPVTGNIVAQSPFGILLNCTAGKNVHSNTILDATIGLYEVPNGAVLPVNTYYNVGRINGGGC